METYTDYIDGKLRRDPPTGLDVVPPIHRGLFPHQRDLTAWALRRGRAAIFAATGLGKTRMQLEWARHVVSFTGRPVLALAPLAVAQQTATEGAHLDLPVRVCRDGADVGDAGVYVTNYDRLHRFDVSRFGGVVLDESSCIKHHDARTFRALVEAFRDTPFRLAATATPAPNDYTELGTHAEFLGVCSREEMLAEFFCHDGGETQVWRLKRHARDVFWRFVASWGAMIQAPSDLGYPDDGYILPPLSVHQHEIAADGQSAADAGLLFAREALSLSERRAARKASLSQRVQALVETVLAEPDEPWVIWCELNAEQDAIAAALGDRCVSVYGSLTTDEKEARIGRFIAGSVPIIVGKPSIFGFGLNLQRAARMAFVGVTDSWESYFQAVRRCWRFGQARPVDVHVFSHELEGAVVRNLLRKEHDAARMATALRHVTAAMVQSEVRGVTRETNPYLAHVPLRVPTWMETPCLSSTRS